MAEDKKENIISIAQKRFARYGIQKTTMDEIAKEARMGKASLYYYFKSKEEIFIAVIQREAAVLRQKTRQAILTVDSPKEKLYKYILTRMTHLRELGNYYTTIKDEFFTHYEFINQIRKEFIENEMETIKDILDDGIKRKIFEVIDTTMVARMMTIALKGFEYPLIVENVDVTLSRDIKTMLDILYKGLEKR